MRVLVVGGGGREHALAWALARSPGVEKVFVAPGNPGTATVAENVPIPSDDARGLLAFARKSGIDLTVFGPEAPLVSGFVDMFADANRRAFGPTRHAARLEGSKSFAKEFMGRHGVPTADFFVADDPAEAKDAVRRLGKRTVIKADGLAAGKGVFVTDSLDEADSAIERLMVRQELGEAGLRVVVEQQLEGPEVSVMAISDGSAFFLLPTARDHKRLEEGDRGPNTGGMGAVSPAPDWTVELEELVCNRVIAPTLLGMAREGSRYAGVLYVGLMLTAEGPKVLEYNCRFGDPETQAVIPRLEGDLAGCLRDAADGRIGRTLLAVKDEPSVCLVLASAGYPGRFRVGVPINGLDDAGKLEGVVVFHAGTTRTARGYATGGGRVASVVGLGGAQEDAKRRAHAAADVIVFEGKHWRQDIG